MKMDETFSDGGHSAVLRTLPYRGQQTSEYLVRALQTLTKIAFVKNLFYVCWESYNHNKLTKLSKFLKHAKNLSPSKG
ncbi:hypothetical protein AFULGI_00011040 [Archaeoglobus fulgidus DSM 8774]|jgi:hypothetical protein|uniref:Uncharacterized protein n=1 Tax=Archaeoglobus fulgidus DSM 8774 TaxID=1344584 RepID=A0A075WDW3_ARCFL|nr:hypothetical protein AFULGI_00011040 [Archaeoglobus fulgidus DSM 8774]